MNRFFVLFLATFVQCLHAQDLYVWQRSSSTALNNKIKKFYVQSSGRLFFLAGELENDGSVIAVKPTQAVDFRRACPVVRVHIKYMQKSPAQLAKIIKFLYEPWSKTNALQIDLDAPESKLDYYCTLMQELRKLLPAAELSATVLPCHLKHTGAMKKLADACNYYVLQVHGLTKEKNRWFIMDEKTARKAVRQAKALQKPFRIALPFYCHIVERDFLVQPDLYTVAELAKMHDQAIGFRLGIPGEAGTLDLESVLQLLKGKYSPRLDIFWQQQPNGAWYLMVRNQGFFPQKISCRFILPEDTVIMDMDIFADGTLDRPKRILNFMLPPAGTAKPYMWLRCASKNDLNKASTFNIKFTPEGKHKP